MTDKHTLIERLRANAYNALDNVELHDEAANRITALEAEKAELVEALERSRQGWENVIELDLIPFAHRAEAQSLADHARATLAKARQTEGEGNE